MREDLFYARSLSPSPEPLLSTDRVLVALIVALIVVGALFALWPDLDLAVTRFVYEHGGFWGASDAARDARDALRLAPYWLLGGSGGAVARPAAGRNGSRRPPPGAR